jgi:excisionase family DNA binding protein
MTPTELRNLLDRAVEELEPDQIPDAIGACAAAQARLTQRLVTPAVPASPAPPPATANQKVGAVAEHLGVPESYVYELARRGDIPCRRMGPRHVRFDIAAVEQALAVNTMMSHAGSRKRPKKPRTNGSLGKPTAAATGLLPPGPGERTKKAGGNGGN